MRTCRVVDADTIRPLRHRVLRAGLPFETAFFPEDYHPDTRHYAAFDGDRVVACLTLLKSQWEGRNAWQLRGMATDPDYRGSGWGGALLDYAETEAAGSGHATEFWCNAREKAVPFYARYGWVVVGERFEVPVFGPHFKMHRFRNESSVR